MRYRSIRWRRRRTGMGVPIKGVNAVIRVFIVAAMRILEEMLRATLNQHSSFIVVGSATDTLSAIRAIEEFDAPPDIVLVDVYASRSIDTTRLIDMALPSVRIVCLGVTEGPNEVINWAEAGVAGLVSSR